MKEKGINYPTKMQTGNSWSCLPCSFAMILHIPVEEFIEMIGHDGSAEPYEDLPGQKAGFHEQECIEVLQQLGYACTPIEIVPQIMPTPDGPIRPIWFSPEQAESEYWNWQRFIHHLKDTHGVITGVKEYTSKVIGHAVAWNSVVYDPQGYTYSIENAHHYSFIPRVYWKIQGAAWGVI